MINDKNDRNKNHKFSHHIGRLKVIKLSLHFHKMRQFRSLHSNILDNRRHLSLNVVAFRSDHLIILKVLLCLILCIFFRIVVEVCTSVSMWATTLNYPLVSLYFRFYLFDLNWIIFIPFKYLIVNNDIFSAFQ